MNKEQEEDPLLNQQLKQQMSFVSNSRKSQMSFVSNYKAADE